MSLSRLRLAVATAGGFLLAISLASAAPQAKWQRAPQLPAPRTEVAAAAYKGGVVVVGGFAANGSASSRVDLYQPGKRKWRRLPNLPVVVNHAMAATAAGKLYVVGGVSLGAANLAREALTLDLASGKWSTVARPTPREHLPAASANGVVYALAGRLGDLNTNLDTLEVFSPATGGWTKLAPVPYRRGGTGAAVSRGMIVSIGGEEEGGTIGSVYGFDLATQRWRKLPNLPTPRHDLGVVALKDRVFAVAGGTSPGLVSGATEVLDLSR